VDNASTLIKLVKVAASGKVRLGSGITTRRRVPAPASLTIDKAPYQFRDPSIAEDVSAYGVRRAPGKYGSARQAASCATRPSQALGQLTRPRRIIARGPLSRPDFALLVPPVLASLPPLR